MVLAVALHGEHLAVADADVEPAAGAAVPADALHPPLARGGERVGGKAEPGEGRGGGGGLEEVAAREGMVVSRAGSLRVRVGLARGGEPVRRVAVRSSAPAPSRRGLRGATRRRLGRVAALAALRGGRLREVPSGRAVAHEALHEQRGRAGRPPTSRTTAGVASRWHVSHASAAGFGPASGWPRPGFPGAAASDRSDDRQERRAVGSIGTPPASGHGSRSGAPPTGRPAAARGGSGAARARGQRAGGLPLAYW